MPETFRTCGRCGIADANVLDLDTGGAYHPEPRHCIELLLAIGSASGDAAVWREEADRLSLKLKAAKAEIYYAHLAGQRVHDLRVDTVAALSYQQTAVRKLTQARGGNSARAPMPAFTVEISVGGCDFEDVVSRLIEAAEHVRECGVKCSRVWGGAGTHGHVHITTREVTREQYEAELHRWFDAQRTHTSSPEPEGRSL